MITFLRSPYACAFAALAVSLQAGAQETEPGPSPQPARDSSARLEPVTVTAQKRVQSLQDVPISMTVLGAATLDKARIRTLEDAQPLAPNFEMSTGPGTAAVAIRGVGGGGRNVGFDTRVGVYLDGIYIGQSQALGQPLFDIEQVEILRGPQGHLFGRNTVAGAVNITTRPPVREFEATLRGVLGNHDTREFYGSLSGPLGDQVAAKLAIGSEIRDGYTHNHFNGGKLDDLDRQTARGQIRFTPLRDLQFDLYADHTRKRQFLVFGEATTGFFGTPLPGGPLPRHEVDVNTTPYTNFDLDGASLAINYRFAGHTLTAITGYRDTHQDRANDTDYSAHDLFKIRYIDDFRQTSQELRLASPADRRFRYVAGVYWLDERADTDRKAMVGTDTATVVPVRTPGGIVMLPFGAAFRLAPGATVPIAARVDTENLALFGALDIDLERDLTLNLGARYTHETKHLVYNLDGSASGNLRVATLTNYRDRRSDDKLTPSAGFTWAVSPDINVYGKYATGFKSGGWNVDFLNVAQAATGFTFDTETVGSAELGVKGKAWGGRMQYDLAVFDGRYKNYQEFRFVTVGTTTVLQLANAAKVISRGLEASVRLRVARGFDLGANLGLLDATYDSYPDGGGPGVDLSGQRILNAPRKTATLTADYTWPAWGGRVGLYGEVGYRDAAEAGSGLQPIPERTVVNTRLRYTPDNLKWAVSLWARNLFDRDIILARGQDFFGHRFVTRGQPRSFGIDARYDF